jgi:hypothetical protein
VNGGANYMRLVRLSKEKSFAGDLCA